MNKILIEELQLLNDNFKILADDQLKLNSRLDFLITVIWIFIILKIIILIVIIFVIYNVYINSFGLL